ncbi:MAG: hypothetical protein AAF432_12950 [Planctomycetota bacterium]
METNDHTVKRVRPILEAMERSIDSARRERLNDTDMPVTPEASTPAPTPATTPVSADEPLIGASSPSPRADDELIHPAQRMKARPKRPSAFTNNVNPMDDQSYRSRAS